MGSVGGTRGAAPSAPGDGPDLRAAPSAPGLRAAPVDSFVIDAPAKVNLFLNVLGKRPDGYHEVDTVMQTVGLVDTLEVSRRPGDEVTLAVSGRTEGVPADGGNLVMRAAELLKSRVRDAARSTSAEPRRPHYEKDPTCGPLGAEIRLEKRIPTRAGLGGASSDAASALIGLSRVWGLRSDTNELLPLAAGLGSDVPFFLRGGTARCTGRGENVTWLSAEGELHFVLVFSPPLSTAGIYGLWDTPGLTKRHPNGTFPVGVGVALDLGALARSPVWNSLEEAAFEALPELREVKRDLFDAGAPVAAVSGSGSCVFGIASSPDQAARIAQTLRARGREAVVASSLGARET
jgi:4-diphosphocytidyl-2-C-methyl-D-erythritol kinase